LNAVVRGRVQGVGFREFVRHAGASHGLTGFVRNGDDGRAVEIVAEGDDPALAAFVEALGQGPRFARVESVEVAYSEASAVFSRFSVEM
jgi:acylphosphatase